MVTNHTHDGDPTLPCGNCGKRHARTEKEAAVHNLSPQRTMFHTTKMISALAIAAITLVPGYGIPTVATAISLPWKGENIASLRSGNYAKFAKRQIGTHHVIRTLQTTEDHSGHDHGEEDVVVEEVEVDDHYGHDHGEEEDAEVDDHFGHDHGDEEFSDKSTTNSSNNTAQEDNSLPWGQVIGATLLVNLAALSGCFIILAVFVQRGFLKLREKRNGRTIRTPRRASGIAQAPNSIVVGEGVLFDICIPAFAVGALVATAVFLIFPEALHLIEGGHGVGGHDDHSDHAGEGGADADDHSGHNHRYLQEDSHAGHDDSSESQNAAKFGCAIIGGFLLPLVFAIFFHQTKPEDDIATTRRSVVSGVTSKPNADIGSIDMDEENCESCNPPSKVDIGVSVTAKEDYDSLESGKPGIIRMVDEEEEVGKAPPQDRHEGCDLCEDDDDGGGKEHALSSTEQESPSPEGQEAVPLVTKMVVDRSLCASILLGDAFHNFADGVFIAAAFKSCSTGTAISIILVTLFHEIAQELADFIILTRYAGLSICKAMVVNFLSGLSVCLGGVVFLAGDPSDQATGIILAMAGGVYFNIAACETIPRLEKIVNSRWDRAWTLLSVIIGTIPIGLILLNHQHCG